jgi:hypothetical protein
MVSIVPESEIFSIFRNLNYKSWFALAEFVDNSLQSYLDWKREPNTPGCPSALIVDIKLIDDANGQKIIIQDNARGIALKDFDRAFKVASRPVKSELGLHEFGMGMKTAGFWFSNRWRVRTSVYGEALERVMEFDLNQILTNRISDIEPYEIPGSKNSSYTIIELESINQFPRGQTLAKVKRYLASIYRRFLISGELELRLNGEELNFDPPKVLLAPYVRDSSENPDQILWKKDVSIELGGDRRVVGWVGLKDTVSSANTGFALFRRGRLVQGGPDDPYSPEAICATKNKHQFLRLFGELDVQGFGVTHTKDAIDWREYEEEFIEKLKIQLKTGDQDFIYQATHFRLDKPKPEAVATLVDQVDIPISRAPEFFNDILGLLSTQRDEAVPEIQSNSKAALEERSFTHRLDDGSEWRATVRVIESRDSDLIKISASNDDLGTANGSVNLEISTGHPFFLAYADPDLDNMEPLMQFLGVLAISIGYSKLLGAKHQTLIETLNRIAFRWSSD